MVICINVEFVLGLAIAVLLNRPFPGRRIVRLILMVPLMLAPLLVGLQFKWFFDDRAGVLNAFLGLFGATQRPIGWLSDPQWALFSLMIAEIWQNTPFMILVFMAGLAGLSQEVLEAAEVDGANAWQRFRYVTFPMLGPLISIALTIRSLDAARVYDIVMIMTKGGPGNSTEMLGTFIYRTAITRRTFGYASAISYVSLVVTFLFAALLIRQIIKSRMEAL
jgi:multiple sugar transport system permease protein